MMQTGRQWTRPTKSHSARAILKTPRTRTEAVPRTRRNDTVAGEGSSRMLRTGTEASFLTMEDLKEQNTTLKLRINSLKETLTQQKSREVHDNQTLNSIRKQFEAYDSEKYFGKRGHKVVEGVKHQYRLIKKSKYDSKCQEFDTFLSTPSITSQEEVRKYHAVLEEESRRLNQQLGAVLELEGELTARGDGRARLEEILGVSAKVMALEQRGAALEEKNARLEERVAELRQKLSQKDRKIRLLDRLITEKANQAHHLARKQKKMAREHRKMGDEVSELQEKLKRQEADFTEMVSRIKEREATKFTTEKGIFSRCLREKEEELEQVTRQLGCLSTIISYMQMGEEMQPELQMEIESIRHEPNPLPQFEKALLSLVEGRRRVQTTFETKSERQPMGSNSPQMRTENLRMTWMPPFEGEASEVDGFGELRQTRFAVEAHPPSFVRIDEGQGPLLSSVKHSSDCLKVRLVRPEEIAPLREELVYRLIHYGWEWERVGACLQGEGPYVSMAELWEALENHPFELKKGEAELLARYMVQDNTCQQVYYHPDNQIERNIAVSILKAFLGEYTLPDVAAAREEIASTLETYGKNLNSALSSLLPDGLATAAKFVEICGAIQVTFSANAQAYILGELLARSASWDRLQYDFLFEGQL